MDPAGGDMSERDPKKARMARRTFVTTIARIGGLAVLGGGASALMAAKALEHRAGPSRTVWQIDPWKCTQCGKCATECVLDVSAAKCVHDMVLCGFCGPCFGFFRPDHVSLDTGGENQLCPVGAIHRKFVEPPYFEYTIDEKKCVGCALCVKGCTQFGNGSLYLQVRHDRCLNCNECSIAAACPANAFIKRPVENPYVIKHNGRDRI
jgi:electron transport complex protein RnfB